MGRRLTTLLVVAALAAALACIGIYAVKSSGYLTVSQLLELKHDSEVIVRAKLLDVRVDEERGVVYLLLGDDRGSTVLAVVSLSYLERAFGPVSQLRWGPGEVVVKGVYKASERVLLVEKVLRGCHRAYEQQTVTS